MITVPIVHGLREENRGETKIGHMAAKDVGKVVRFKIHVDRLYLLTDLRFEKTHDESNDFAKIKEQSCYLLTWGWHRLKCLCPPQNSCVKILTPNVVVSGGGDFGR